MCTCGSKHGGGGGKSGAEKMGVMLLAIAGLAVGLGVYGVARGAEPENTAEVVASQPAPGKPAPGQPAGGAPAGTPASLDDLLGLKPVAPAGQDASKDGPKIEPARVEQAQRMLENSDSQQPDDEFTQAVALMNQSAKRLGRSADASLETQRLQQDTINKLEQLIKKAQKKQRSSSSCSNGSCDQNQSRQSKGEQQGSKGSQQQPQQSQASQQDGKQGQKQQAQARTERSGTGDREQITAGSLDTKLGQQPGGLDAARAAWGNLPARLRQSLLQGSGDAFSSEYQRLTEAYYKRLGEQQKK